MIEADKLAGQYGAELVLQVHDEVVYEVPEANVQAWGDILVQLGAEVGNEFLTVPLRLEVQVGPNWADTTPMPEWN